jgi:hypothetical protein
MTSEQQKAYYAENARKGKTAEKAQDDKVLKPVREAGEAARKGMEEGRMDAMGNAYKSGGSIRGHGIEQRGKTKGKFITMCGGGSMGKKTK